MTDAQRVAGGLAGAAEVTPADGRAPTPLVPASQPGLVAFEHRFFSAFPDLYFYRPELGGDPVAVVNLGENEAILTFRGIKSEFGIPDDAPDGRMLALVANALSFVNGLRVGDPIPKEVVTGEASWEPSKRHYEIAYNRLTLQLASWMSGNETVIADTAQLMQLAADPQTRHKVEAAIEQAADRLGLGGQGIADVTTCVNTLGESLAFIESLREKVLSLSMIERKLEVLRRLYGLERSVSEAIDPCIRLAANAHGQFKAKLRAVDSETAEIIGALQELDRKLEIVRIARDELRRRLMAWTEVIEAWHACKPEVSEQNDDLIQETYRFLAPRYLLVSEWALMTRAAARTGGRGKPKTRTLVRGAKPVSRLKRW
jgi:hypothetical protein